jgi:exosortase
MSVLSAQVPTRDDTTRKWKLSLVLPIGLAVLCLIWTYWPVIRPLFRDWQNDENYSVGQLVPLGALYLLWHDRKRLRNLNWKPEWLGLIPLVVAQLMLFYGLIDYRESAQRYGMVLTIVSLVLLIGGRDAFWRTRWILLFLFLMVPWPGKIHNLISAPLQNLATSSAVVLLELGGIVVSQQGHVLMLNHSVPVAVAEACSGLRMLTAFVVVAAVLAYIIDRPKWQKVVLIASSIPVAIVCNSIRLVVTAFLFLKVDSETAEHFFHDFAGLTMMPLALFMLVGELWLMSKLIIEDKHE